MPYTETIIRGERFKIAWAPEATYGVDPGTATYTNIFGVVQNATLPDPTVEVNPIYALGANSNRNWYTAYLGKLTLGAGIGDIWLLDGRMLALGIGTSATGGTGPYVHTVSETTSLRSFALHTTMLDTNGSPVLMRRWMGGKVNRMTISASEGDFLKASLDDIQFINLSHNQVGENYYDAGVADISPVYPTTQPYLFSYGTMSLNNNTFARIRDFRIEVNNSLDAKYYITNQALQARLPYEHREGKREYRLTCTIDISDGELYRELVRLGSYTSTFKGFAFALTFTRSTGDYITISSPTTGPGPGGDSMGCLIRSAPHNIADNPVVSVALDILMRNMQIVISDSIATYPTDSQSDFFIPRVGFGATMTKKKNGVTI